MTRRCLAATIVLAALAAHADAAPPPGAVPFTRGSGGAVIVPAFADGQGPFLFVLDTGAAGSAVTETLADRVGLVATERTLVITPLGEETRAVARLGRLAVGAAEAEGLRVTIVGDAPLRRLGPDVVGLLGQDFLSRFDVTIDYRRGLVAWNDGAAAGAGVHLTLHPSQGHFLVELPQDGRRAPLRMVPDSGAGALVMFAGPEDSPLDSRPAAQSATLESASGDRSPVEMRRVPRLRVGDLTLRDQPAVFIARPAGTDAPASDGLLPLHVFSSVTFARAGHLVLRSR